MKAYIFLFLTIFSISAYGSSEPLRVNDWTLTSPFTYGFSKGVTLGLYEAKQPTTVTSSMPSVAEMPIGLVGYVEHNNRFSTLLGTSSGAFVAAFILLCLFYGAYHRMKGS